MPNILMITHNSIGEALLATAQKTLGTIEPNIRPVSVSQDVNPDILLTQLQDSLNQLDQGNGVLILTDIFGSTPSNIAKRLQTENKHRIRFLSGLNLPMLLRAINYANLPLADMAQKAFEGGRDGVCICTCTSNLKTKVSYDTKVCHDN